MGKQKKKKEEIPEWMKEFDDRHYWTKDKGFYGHLKLNKIKRIKITGC